jgi:flagella basal body P-ring formation protein FlgA
MKKFALVTLMVLLAAGPAMAGNLSDFNPYENLAVGTAQISRGDLARLRDLVAGRGVAQATAAPTAETVNAGVVRVSRQDLDQIRDMVAGTYQAPIAAPVLAVDETVDVGKVEMRRGEFMSLKQMVARHLHDDLGLTALAD